MLLFRPVKDFLNAAALRFLADISGEPLSFLLHPLNHADLLVKYRAEMIISRVRMVSAMFAVLTPLWIFVDFLAFDLGLALKLASGRIVTTLAFALLALYYKSSPLLRDAYRSLALMFVIPTLFFVYSHVLLSGIEGVGGAATVAAGYAFLPFVLVAGLSVFPLTAIEGIVFSLPVLASSALVAFMQTGQMNWSTHLGAFWLLLLITATASLASMSQLAFMSALIRQANHDPLTGCFNRASGEELFNLQFSIALRNGSPFTIVFIDLDHFKSVNDSFGHEAGDLMLRSAAETIRASLRSGDALIRWGGEEFLLVLPDTDHAAAISILSRLRDTGLGLRPDGSPLTASYGLAEILLDRVKSSSSMLELADTRMYLAKNTGRNRWVGCTPTP